MEKIKILVDGISVGLGGIGSVIMSIVEKLDMEKFEPTILFTYDSAYEPIFQQLGIKSVKICPLGKSLSKYKKQLEEVYKNGDYDYVWVNNTGKVNIMIFKLAKKYGVKTISHSHGEKQEWSFLKGIVFGMIEKFNQKAFYQNVDVALACSDNSAKYFYDTTRMGDKPIYVLDNAVDLPKFAFDEEARKQYREQLGWTDKIIIGAVGRICTVKNHKLLVDAFAKLENKGKYKLVIVGGGELKEELVSQIEQNKLENSVELLGVRSDIPNLLSAMDMYTLPSLNEGYCVSLIEAHSNGLTCLVSDSVKRPWYDDDIHISITNVEEWTKQMQKATLHPQSDRVAQMQAMGLGIDNMVNKFQNILIENLK